MTTFQFSVRRDGDTSIVQFSGDRSATAAWRSNARYAGPLDKMFNSTATWAALHAKDMERFNPGAAAVEQRKHVAQHVAPDWRSALQAVSDGHADDERARLAISQGFIPADLPFGGEDRARWAGMSHVEREAFIRAATLDELAAVAASGQARAGADDDMWARLIDRVELLGTLHRTGIPAQFPAPVTLDNITGRGVDWAAAEREVRARMEESRSRMDQTANAERVLRDMVAVVAVATDLTADAALALLRGDE